MAYFKTNTEMLRSMSTSENIESGRLNQWAINISSISRNLEIDSPSIGNVKSYLLELADYVNREKVCMRDLSRGLSDISTLYEDTENRICQNPFDGLSLGALAGQNISSVINGALTKKNVDDSEYDWKLDELFLDIMDEYGPAKLFVGQCRVLNPDSTPIDRINGGISIADAAGTFLKDSPEWAEFGSGVKTVCKWVGPVMVFAEAAYDNIKEYNEKKGTAEEISEARATGEALIQGGLKLGAWTPIPAVVALVVAGPEIVVGVAGAMVAVGVLWGADRISNAIFGKDATEVVADAICDFAEDAVDEAKNAFESVGNAIENYGNSIAAWAF